MDTVLKGKKKRKRSKRSNGTINPETVEGWLTKLYLLAKRKRIDTKPENDKLFGLYELKGKERLVDARICIILEK